MWVIVYCNDGYDSGMVYLCRKLADDEIMNARTFADEIARQFDREIDDSVTEILNCFGDLRVEFMDYKPKIQRGHFQGATCIWSGESFYFKSEE